MYAYIKGELVQKNPAFVVVENNGIGYLMNISLNSYTKIQNEKTVKLHTYLHITEDAHTMYGFADESEKILFQQLISVSGVGCSTARMILSSILPNEIQQAIIQENEKLLEKIKGIGPKTAKRMILELKDKMLKTTDIKNVSTNNFAYNNIQAEALSALMALGFNRTQADSSISKINKAMPGINTVEALIKEALKAI
ncbi:MAG: Holliday junction branch migration protein RuvA [Bacteroidota bacterium]|jgi:Holliday junction DNA helicase RuvA